MNLNLLLAPITDSRYSIFGCYTHLMYEALLTEL